MPKYIIGDPRINPTLDFTEFDKLVGFMEKEGWNYRVEYLHDGKKLNFFSKNGDLIDDAVIHGFSHGGKAGLLECYVLNDCSGWMTAEEVFNGWKGMWEPWLD